MRYYITINDKRYEVEVEKGEVEIVSSVEIEHEVTKIKDMAYIQAATTKTDTNINITEIQEPASEMANVTGKEVVRAPIAGEIIYIKVGVGSVVKKGDTLLLLEAMKMENEILANIDGIVADVKVSKGTKVSYNEILVIFK